MSKLWLAGVIAIGLAGYMLWQFVPLSRTLYLIARVTPYQQDGTGGESVLILGDSTGYGTGASRAKDSVAGRLGQSFPSYSIENNSVNGRTIAEGIEAISELTKPQYDLILMQLGANDILQRRTVEETEVDLRRIFESLSEFSDTIIMMSNGNVGGAPRFDGQQAEAYRVSTLNFRDMYQRVSADFGVIYVDLYEDPSEDPFVQEPDKYTSHDGLHPSSIGYAYWYAALEPHVTAALK